MKKEKENYICFIDLVGTKDLTTFHPEDYISTITDFQKAIIKYTKVFSNENDRVYFFSDGAYIESSNLLKLISYLQELRSDLSPTNHYFKAAITTGLLGAITGYENEEIIRERFSDDIADLYKQFKKDLKLRQPLINGTIFLSKDVSKAYSFQESLKGLGIFVEGKLVPKISKHVVKSFYIPDILGNKTMPIWDIKMKEEELGEYNVRNVFRNYMISNTKSKKYGRYYLTFLATLINSTDFSVINYFKSSDLPSDKKIQLSNEPLILNILLELNKRYEPLYSKAHGLDFLYFVLLNKVYSDCNESLITKEILRKVLKLKKIFTKYLTDFNAIPNEIMSYENRNSFIRDFHYIYTENFLNE